MNKTIKYGTIVEAKKPVYFYYDKTKEKASPWMVEHNRRGIIKSGPYVSPDKPNNKFWGVTWEGTGQAVTLNENEFKVID